MPAEHPPKTPSSPRTGIFAVLSSLLGAKGTGLSKNSQGTTTPKASRCLPVSVRVIPTALLMTLGGLIFITTPALAAGPPEIGPGGEFTSPQARPSEEVRFEAAINPNEEPTKCDFQYGETVAYGHEAACSEPGEIAEGTEQRAAVTVTGLKPGTTYHYRVVLKNASGKAEGPDAEVATAPETPETGKANPASITATTATLEDGVLNPHIALGEDAEYEYRFRVSATECEGESSTAGMAAGGLKEKVPPVDLTNLQPNVQYTFCLFERSLATGQTSAASPPAHFTTKPAPPEVIPASESATGVTGTEASLSAAIEPNNQSTTYTFEYATNAALTENLETESGASALTGFNPAGEPASVALTGLTPHTTYYYRVVAENATHEKATPGKVEHFTTGPLEAPTEGLQAKPIAATEATLNGVLNPGGPVNPATYEFRYRQSAAECEGGQPEEEKITPAEHATGAKQEPVQAKIEALLPHTQYTFCLRESNEAGEETLSPPSTFTTLAAVPKIEGQSVSEVADTSATLDATVNPQGAETSYTFELARAGGSFEPIAEAGASGMLPEGVSGVPLSVHIQQGLSAATAYEFRVVVGNSVQQGVTREPPVSFTTQTTNTSFALPDNRQWEMVSPPQKEGAAILFETDDAITEAATNGDAIAYNSKTPTEAEPRGYTNSSSTDLSTRGSAGWQTRDLAVPQELQTGSPVGGKGYSQYRFFSSDLSQAIVQPFSLFTPCTSAQGTAQPCLSSEASEQTAFLSTNFSNGNLAEPCLAAKMPCARPLVTGKEPFANVPPGTVFGGEQEGKFGRSCEVGEYCGPFFVAATPSLSHVVLESDVGLTAGAGSEGGLYEWSAGKLTFIGKGENEAGPGESTTNQGAYASHGAHGISTDGSRVILRGKSEGLEGLLLRDTVTEETVRLGEGEFQTASADDSRVFFDTAWNKELEDDGHPPTGQLDVWEQTSAPGAPLAGKVTQLTEGLGGIRGLVLGASEDGSYVYFVSNGVLAGSGATGAGNNLYVDHYDAETGKWRPTFIATLSSEDEHDWLGGESEWAGAQLLYQPTRVSPNGEWLAFMSQNSLTGYDNYDAVSGGRTDAEVYLYHADPNGHIGTLTCASCDPTGARPVGVEQTDKGNIAVGEFYRAWSEGMVAAGLPGWYDDREKPLSGVYQGRYLSNSGRLFFNSSDSLVPQDTNGAEDVYEYEPKGIESPEGKVQCSAGSSSGSDVFEPARTYEVEGHKGEAGAGCVALISSGTSSEGSVFLDASENGGDVFFMTSAKLAAQDKDTVPDVYDAHECTSESPCVAPVETPPPCTTEASCKASPTPQPSIYGAPSSATFSGPGNLAPPSPVLVKKITKKTVKCKKGLVKNKKGKCVKKSKSKKKAKAKKSDRATNDRRGN